MKKKAGFSLKKMGSKSHDSAKALKMFDVKQRKAGRRMMRKQADRFGFPK